MSAALSCLMVAHIPEFGHESHLETSVRVDKRACPLKDPISCPVLDAGYAEYGDWPGPALESVVCQPQAGELRAVCVLLVCMVSDVSQQE